MVFDAQSFIASRAAIEQRQEDVVEECKEFVKTVYPRAVCLDVMFQVAIVKDSELLTVDSNVIAYGENVGLAWYKAAFKLGLDVEWPS